MSIIQILYNEITLTTAEIACLYGISYHTAYNIINNLPIVSPIKAGRRNSSYGKKFGEERLTNMSNSLKGRPAPPPYERTKEIRDRISNTLKEGYRTGRIPGTDPLKLSQAWADGKYAHVKMGRGFQGFMYSIKNNRDIYFRSLLELCILIMLEQNIHVTGYIMEPFQIKLGNGHHYTPDLLVFPDNIVLEIKPYEHYKYADMDRFYVELGALNNYCIHNNLRWKVIYDKDVGFVTKQYIRFLRDHPEYISTYNIRFKRDPFSSN